ncbi:hypothetical protein SBOR_6185 [Sclerotinia borealis F-4128]|uniref:2EXR domain-containing protein n=1 Tax=Sclerotinia borealis (strain F-4128) TaxID=1432307 RepID=W9CC35_SCLBF|nr:hypothetical protein SBOR_6185 [Sclerotinia borealis F-4128]
MKIIDPNTEREAQRLLQHRLRIPHELRMSVKLAMVSKWPNPRFDVVLKKNRSHEDYDSIIELLQDLNLSELGSFLWQGLSCRSLSEYRDIKYPPVESESKPQLKVGVRTFPSFNRLPAELRLDIWEYVFAEDLLPKVHHLNNTNRDTGRITESITSHLPFSNIVQVCKESRQWYLSRTQNAWAFGTYVNFHSDIMYLTQQIENSNILYETLLSSPPMMKVQNLAMRRTWLTDNPQKAPNSVEAFANIRQNLPSLKNIYVVINEIRRSTIIDKDNDIKFKHLSARQKRKWVDVGYARTWLKWLNQKMMWRGYKSVDYNFVMVGTECQDSLSSKYGEVTFERKIRDGTLELF